MGESTSKRLATNEVRIGDVKIGSDNPVMIQSMTNTSTNDIDGSLQQIKRLREAGAAVVRLTAQGQREVESLRLIKEALKREGLDIPLVADIHFNTAAAFAAADVVDKVRINPGNFVDPGRVFKKIEYTEEEYARQLEELAKKVKPFFELCKCNGVAVRIGVNHGSLSDRIMSRYGDTPEGMVESAMEFLRIARETGFKDIVVSIKSSSTGVMITTVKQLVKAMDKEGLRFPLHLGVTEAGEGEDGRIKSAIGIGTLLSEGIGDTIRVSLSEDPVNEIPVAKEIMDFTRDIANETDNSEAGETIARKTKKFGKIGGDSKPVVIIPADPDKFQGELKPDFLSTDEFVVIDADDTPGNIFKTVRENPARPLLLATSGNNQLGAFRNIIARLRREGFDNPVAVRLRYPSRLERWKVTVRASIEAGALLIDKLVDGISIEAPQMSAEELTELSFGILQGAGARVSKTEYIACPGCGRTLFNLSPTLKRVKEATKHLKGMKIGVMGCIVNGPGEMADADYGYVGAGKGKVSLYRGKDAIEKNVPEEDAVDRLIELMKNDGKWVEP